MSPTQTDVLWARRQCRKTVVVRKKVGRNFATPNRHHLCSTVIRSRADQIATNIQLFAATTRLLAVVAKGKTYNERGNVHTPKGGVNPSGTSVVEPPISTVRSADFSIRPKNATPLTLPPHACPGWQLWHAVDSLKPRRLTGVRIAATPPGTCRDCRLAPYGRPLLYASSWACGIGVYPHLLHKPATPSSPILPRPTSSTAETPSTVNQRVKRSKSAVSGQAVSSGCQRWSSRRKSSSNKSSTTSSISSG